MKTGIVPAGKGPTMDERTTVAKAIAAARLKAKSAKAGASAKKKGKPLATR